MRGTVSGLAGSGLVLQANVGGPIAITGNGPFTATYTGTLPAQLAASVRTQPSGPSQTCSIDSTAITVSGNTVDNVVVTCATDSYAVGGTVSGLAGFGLVLANNGSERLAIAADGRFTFATPVASGASSTVTVESQPAWQQCTVANGSVTIGGAAVTDVAVTCVAVPARFAYAPNSRTDNVSLFTVNPDSGLLVRNTPRTIAAGDEPSAIAADLQGRFVYVANLYGDSISAYAVNTANGLLTAASGATLAAGTQVRSLAVHPNGRFLYAAHGDGVLRFAIDATTGALAAQAPVDVSGASRIALSPDGRFAYLGAEYSPRVHAYAIDAATGALTAIAGSPFTTASTTEHLGVTSDGRHLVMASDLQDLVMTARIDPATGAVTQLAQLAVVDLRAIVVHPRGNWVYALANGSSPMLHPLALDATSGALTVAAPPVAVEVSPDVPVFDPSGRVLHVAIVGDRLRAYAIDPASGGATLMTPNNPVGGISADGPRGLAFVR